MVMLPFWLPPMLIEPTLFTAKIEPSRFFPILMLSREELGPTALMDEPPEKLPFTWKVLSLPARVTLVRKTSPPGLNPPSEAVRTLRPSIRPLVVMEPMPWAKAKAEAVSKNGLPEGGKKPGRTLL